MNRSPSGSPRVSVLIAASGPSHALDACLRLVTPQVEASGAELILVLNCAADAVAPAAADALRVRVSHLLFEPCVGKSNALNRGLAACRGEVIAFTDDDALPAPSWLEQLTAPLLAAERPSRLVGVGGRVTPRYGPGGAPAWYRELIASRPSHFLGPRHEPSGAGFEYALDATRGIAPLGANCAYRNEVFEKLRFDPELGPNRETGLRGGEDTLLGWQALQQGWRVAYRPEAEILHPVPAQRVTVAHVLEAYFVQGIEIVRLVRALEGRDISLRRSLKRLRKVRRRAQLRLVFPGGTRLVRAACRYEYRRGIVAELDGSFRARAARALGSDISLRVRQRMARAEAAPGAPTDQRDV